MRVSGEKRREMLLGAALDLFAQQGYDATSTRSIAEATGVTEAVLFQHFSTKRDLFLALLREVGPGEALRYDPTQSRDLPIPDALSELVTAYLDMVLERRDWLRVLHQEAGKDETAAWELREQYRAVGDALMSLLRERADRGEIDPEMIGPAVQVIALAVRGYLARRFRSKREDSDADREVFVTNLVSVVTGGILTRPEMAPSFAGSARPETR
jgi:AcrR family transcriptional regulator